MLDQALGLLAHDLAIDLGTSTTRVYVRGRGIVVEEPSVVAVERTRSGTRVVAIGAEAKRMVGRTPEHITAARPIREGVIADFELAESLLRACLSLALGNRPLVKPRLVICIPFGITEVERRAVQESARAAGAREVALVGKPIAAAVGAGLPINDPVGNLAIDIGGGTTEVGVISLGGVVSSSSIRVAGDAMDKAIADWIRRRHNVLVGERTAEEVKLRVGCVQLPDEPRRVQVRGRDLSTGIPREVTLESADACEALAEPAEQILEAIRATLERTPPELAADIVDQGMVLCGGASMLPGLAAMIRDATELPVVLAEDPRRCAVLGAGQLLEDPETLARVEA